MNYITLALTGLSIAFAGCGESQPATTADTTDSERPRTIIPDSKLNLPEFYGMYAVVGTQTLEMKAGIQDGELSRDVEFLLFHQLVSTGMTDVKLFSLGVPPLKLDSATSDEFKGWDDWFQKSQVDMPAQFEAALKGLPVGSTPISLRGKPVPDQPDMIRIVPTSTLKPGLYQLGEGKSKPRFWVERQQYMALHRDRAVAALEAKDWQVVIDAASAVLAYEQDEDLLIAAETAFKNIEAAEHTTDNALIKQMPAVDDVTAKRMLEGLGWPALFEAAAWNDVALLRRLLDANENPNQRYAGKPRPGHELRKSVQGGSAVPDASKLPDDTKSGWTPLMIAASAGSVEAIEVLLEHGAQINADAGQTSPLAVACRMSQLDAVKVLLARGADIRHVDAIGRTALHWACLQNQVEIVQALLDAGCDPNSKDQLGRTPAASASASENPAIVAIFKSLH